MEHNRLPSRACLLSFFVAAFVAIHLFLFHRLWHGNLPHGLIPGALAFVVILLVAATHVGLLAVLVRRFHSVFGRRR